MKANLIIIAVTTLFVSLVAKSNVCMEYSGKDFVLQKTTYTKNKVTTKNSKVDNIKIYFFKNRSSTKPITLEYSVKGHKKYYKYIFCMKEGDKEWCGIECDGGGFYANSNLDIYVEYPLRVLGEPEGNLPEIEIAQKGKKYIKGKAFKCPKKLPKVKNLPDDKYYKDNINGKYVCYDYKNDNKYYGCFRSIKKCKELHLQHFGKYGTKKAVKDALKRCKKSKPNKDYIDNPKGKYVCYDYIDSNGEYNGCFRAHKSCKKLNKKHFGYYRNTKESRKALLRCEESLPKI